MQVNVQHMNYPALLYRVGHSFGSFGLWYNAEGKETGQIHTLRAAVAAHLPMGPHEIFRADGRHWISATDTLPALANWFSYYDMLELIDRGFVLQEISVHHCRHFQFEGYGHHVFCNEDVISKRTIDPMLPYKQMAQAA